MNPLSPSPGAGIDRRAADLRLADAEARLRRTPARMARPAVSRAYLLNCGGGNGVVTYGATTYYGLLTGTTITTLPTAVPPGTTDGSNPTGLTWAYLWDRSGASTLVWMAISVQVSGVTTSDMAATIIKGAPIVSRKVIVCPVTAGGTALVYIPWQIG